MTICDHYILEFRDQRKDIIWLPAWARVSREDEPSLTLDVLQVWQISPDLSTDHHWQRGTVIAMSLEDWYAHVEAIIQRTSI